MTSPMPSLLMRLTRLGAFGALAVALLVWPLYAVAASSAATYQQIDPVDEALVPVNQFTYAEEPTGADEDIVAIYGNAKGAPTAYVFVDESLVIRPEEKPALVLLKAPAQGQPTQLAFVRFFIVRLSIGAFLGALVLFGLGALLRRRAAPATLEPAAT